MLREDSPSGGKCPSRAKRDYGGETGRKSSVGRPQIGVRPYRHRWAQRVDAAIGLLIEPTTVGLLIVEIGILAAGVYWRYVLRNSLVWTDELATFLLVWLGMLGAVVAYRRDQHVRLTAVIRARDARFEPIADAVGAAVIAIFALEVLPTFGAFIADQNGVLSPALAIPHSYVVVSIYIGVTLLLVLAMLRLLDAGRPLGPAIATGAVVVCAVAYLARGVFHALGNADLLIFFVGVLGSCVAIGIPIGFAFGFSSFSYLLLSTDLPSSALVGRMDEGMSSLILLAVPLFVILGLLIEAGGIAKRLVEALASVVGHIRGGLGIVLVFAMYLVSGISGSKFADMAAVAPVLFPEMERRGMPRAELVAMLGGSAAMAETIPPSLVLIIIGSVTNLSIGALFAAGLVPAAVAGLFLLLVVLWRSRNDRMELAKRPTAGAILRAFIVALPGFALPLLIRAAILGGVATATEVSTIAIFYALAVGILIYREFDWNRAYPIFLETAGLTGAFMLILATATAMAFALTQSGFAQSLADALGHAPGGKAGFLALSILLFIVLGSVLEGLPAIVLFGPLLFPIAESAGVNQIHYAIVAILAMGVGLFSPPLGAGYYGACLIGRCDPGTAMYRFIPYMLAIIVGLIIVAAFPVLSIGFGGVR
jgi:tripartite ATP-independent transporter DctM subunit